MRISTGLSLGLLPAVALSAPAPRPPATLHLPIQRRGLDIRQMAPEDRLASLVRSIHKVKRRHGIPISAASKAKRASSANVPMGGSDASYFATIEVGTPAANYEVVLDTGSSDLFLATAQATNLCSTGCTTTAKQYNPSSSTTAQNLGQAVDLEYGSGDAQGDLYSDVVTFAGFTMTTNLTAVTKAENLFDTPDEDGLCGLAWQTLSSTGSMPFLQGLWTAGALTQPLFSMALAELPGLGEPTTTNIVGGGVMTVGGTDSSYYSGTIAYTKLYDGGSYWDIPLSDIGISGKSLGVTIPAVIIDSGTNSIVFPQDLANLVYESITGAEPYDQSEGIYSYPCSSTQTVSFTFGGTAYSISTTNFNLGPVSSGSSQCIGAIVSGGTGQQAESTFVIGTPFLMGLYTVYSFSPPSVGFATRVDSGNALEGGAVPESTNTVSAAGILVGSSAAQATSVTSNGLSTATFRSTAGTPITTASRSVEGPITVTVTAQASTSTSGSTTSPAPSTKASAAGRMMTSGQGWATFTAGAMLLFIFV